MRVRGVPAHVLAEAGARLLASMARPPRRRLPALVLPVAGRSILQREERRLVLGVDGALRRLGIRCLRRAVIVAEMLRRRGVAARVELSVAIESPVEAHAEVEVGGQTLRRSPSKWVTLR
jgi:hypothetical protein